MGYNNKESFRGKDHCVTDVVRDIVKAQHRVAEALEDTCATSCEQSIEDLLSPARERPGRSRHNTIPFMLFCDQGCKPFVGSGVIKSDGRFFNCIESPIFRVKKFVRGSNSCAIIELLEPVRGGRGDHGHGHKHGESGEANENNRHGDRHGRDRGSGCGCGGSVCNFFPNDRVRSFRATGICITIDLDCFCGITCLEPITIR